MDLLSSFVEALETAPARLHDKERQEVISGLVARAGRDLIAVLTAPDLWCMEHGAHIVRMLVETKIYLHWMAQQDPSIYREFQEYGAGKAKLYARISDEVPAEARKAGFQEAIEEFERLSHNHDVFDHRVVDTRDTFAGGKSIRAMAEETGLLDFYRQAYSLASGVAHSEWWSVETHAMEPCLNVLHGLHLIPSLSLSFGGNVPLASSWVTSSTPWFEPPWAFLAPMTRPCPQLSTGSTSRPRRRRPSPRDVRLVRSSAARNWNCEQCVRGKNVAGESSAPDRDQRRQHVSPGQPHNANNDRQHPLSVPRFPWYY